MLIFRNPGLIDLEAVRTLGVSVKLPGSFGRFGTGLKFAIARILRGGGSITIYRGLEAHTLGTVDREVRGETFQIVTLDGEPMGITTQLGKDWEPWMVLRELGCNALDEGGGFNLQTGDDEAAHVDGATTIIVNWPALDEAYADRDSLFISAKSAVLYADNHIRILDGPCSHIFYRGVRVAKLDRAAIFTYDLLAEQKLTEDRTLAYQFYADRLIVDTWLTMTNREMLDRCLLADSYYEHKLDFKEHSYGIKPGKTFLDACMTAREAGHAKAARLNQSAKSLLLTSMRSDEDNFSNRGYQRVVNDAFEFAKEQLEDLGIEFDRSQKFITVDELPDGVTSMIENGHLYILDTLFSKPAREIAIELLSRWVDLKVPSYDLEGAVKLLAPFVLKNADGLASAELLVEEDEAPEPAAKDWVLTGEWSGYTSAQAKIVHVEKVTAERAAKLDYARIEYTDGTTLHLRTRELNPGEEVKENPNYDALIRKCLEQGVWRVADLDKDPASEVVEADEAF